MIIGQDSHFISLIQYYLRGSAYQAVSAPLDRGAVALARQENPAMIVLEADHTESAGRKVLQALKLDQATHDIPVLVCSWQSEGLSALSREADFYLRKPVSYDDFLAWLDAVNQERSDARKDAVRTQTPRSDAEGGGKRD
jgi:DNA-binding response OmpR family regulator